MTSSSHNDKCKLLVLDLDINTITSDILHTFFSLFGPVEWVEIVPESNSAIVHFTSQLIVDHLISLRTCVIGQSTVRLRRFRLDPNNWHIDSQTLLVKLTPSTYSKNILTNENLRYAFQAYQSDILSINIIHENQALISFLLYDFVDQIILMPESMFKCEGITLVFERMMEKKNLKSRWDHVAFPLPKQPILAERDPIAYKLLCHIEHLTKQLREQPIQYRNKIEQLEAEVFVLKNENALLKSKHKLSSNQNLEKRLMALENISNRLVNKKHSNNQREINDENAKPLKRQRLCSINDEL